MAKHGLSFDDMPAPADEAALIRDNGLRRRNVAKIASVPVEKNHDGSDPGITELTLPKGHSIQKLKDLVKETFGTTDFQIQDDRGPFNLINPFVNMINDKTCRVYVTNGVLEGSRNKDVHQKQNLIKDLKGEVPDYLTVATLVALSCLSSSRKKQVRLFSTNGTQPTFTECTGNFVVGGFTANTLYIRSKVQGNDYHGVALMVREP